VKAAVAGGVNAADDCGWWLAAGRSQLVAGWPVVAFLDLLLLPTSMEGWKNWQLVLNPQ
jgi:hypothetical protein